MAASEPATRHLSIGDELIRWSTRKRALGVDFGHENNVIFVHGFTSHGSYMEELIQYFDDSGFRSFAFNYNSYRGIRNVAQTLFELLDGLDEIALGVIRKNRVSFVCHSMGGLVVRAFTYISGASDFIRKIVTLGTPHVGTMQDSGLIDWFVKWGEFVTSAMPGFSNKECLSLRELRGDDQPNPLLESLKQPNPTVDTIPVLSASGGHSRIELGSSSLVNYAANRYIQKVLGDGPNNGLVAEKSSNAEGLRSTGCITNVRHYNSYSEYEKINHKNLTQNFALGLKLIKWLNSESYSKAEL